MKLYSYFRSSAAYRVRIALGLKRLPYTIEPINLVDNVQRSNDYLQANPQGLVPALELDSGEILGQSVAILEWLEETYPDPALYSASVMDRATQRSLCMHIACDIHPLNNMRILRYLGDELSRDQETVSTWYAHWIRRGFGALEPQIAAFGDAYSLGDRPGMLEVMLIPQLFNARRFNVPVDDFPGIIALDQRCNEWEAFVLAHPGRQPDTPGSERL